MGNLDVEVQYSSDDELGKLADSFRVTVTTLNKIIEDLGYILEEFAQGNYAVDPIARNLMSANLRMS